MKGSKSERTIFVRVIHSGILIIWTLISATVFSTAIIISRPFSKKLCQKIARTWCRILTAFSGVRLTVRGLEKLDPDQNYFFISNHCSAADIYVLYTAIPHALLFVAKRSLFRIPFFGWGLRALGNIPLDRTNPKKARKTIENAAAVLTSGDASLFVFPEGTRSRTGRLGEFKLGVFSLAVRAGIPVVPMGIQGTYEFLPRGSFLLNPGPVSVLFGDPIFSSNWKRSSKSQIAQEAWKRISQLLSDKNTD